MRISMFFLVFAFSMQNIDKLKKVVEEGNYYGAQQMYKSISARYENCVDKKKKLCCMLSDARLGFEPSCMEIECGCRPLRHPR